MNNRQDCALFICVYFTSGNVSAAAGGAADTRFWASFVYRFFVSSRIDWASFIGLSASFAGTVRAVGTSETPFCSGSFLSSMSTLRVTLGYSAHSDFLSTPTELSSAEMGLTNGVSELGMGICWLEAGLCSSRGAL